MRHDLKKRGRPPTETTKVQHVRFDVSTLGHLEEIASNQGGRSVASVIRQIVTSYLKTQRRQPEDFSDLIEGSPIHEWNRMASNQEQAKSESPLVRATVADETKKEKS